MYEINNLLINIRKDLRKNIDFIYKESIKRFFKEDEELKHHGIRSAVVDKISKNYFKEIKDLDKEEIFNLCERLLQSRYGEETSIAFNWAFYLRKKYTKQDFKIFESWLKKYVDNWGKCDTFCTKAFGYFILQFPDLLPRLNIWAKSKNRWLRRASAVILIYPIKKNKYFLKKVFEIADNLLLDSDDLVQKGYGWMLKEASNIYQKEIFDYVMKNKDKMPRTALRYAIEKMPQKLKREVMKR